MLLAKDDACATAAEIYQCGLKNNSVFVNDLISQQKGTTNVEIKLLRRQ